eukprot:CAMPEP_0184855286 /NCGR_PEP_ID=MMETSP0580-20130426/578_1 /TAXON_ID=1118495 /ORGANISM="Dactyliosolen fragilissimus" /LENGTH=418 /DNA_ID=CAMNT_0027349761 /DNA_START=251 /DNA_END=1508 /DNA_ORIENTATION=-
MIKSTFGICFLWLLCARHVESIQSQNLRSRTKASSPDSSEGQNDSIENLSHQPLSVDTHSVDRDLIINGVDANKGRYGYMVSITTSNGSHYCGGTLIAQDIVLTAAHCDGPIQKVQIGRYDFSDKSETPEIFNIIDKVKHPEFINNNAVRGDVMLLRIDGKSKYKTVRLHSREDTEPIPHGTSLTVVGWGSTNDNGHGSSDKLQEVELKSVSNYMCKRSKGYVNGQTKSYASLILDQHICAIDTNEDSCSGDSGGPLILKSNNPSKPDTQVGIVSFGFGCKLNDFPGVYQRVSNQYKWIRDTACRLTYHDSKRLGCGANPSLAPTNKPTLSPVSLNFVTVKINSSRDEYTSDIGIKIVQTMKNKSSRNKVVRNLPPGSFADRKKQDIVETFPVDQCSSYKLIVTDIYGDGILMGILKY